MNAAVLCLFAVAVAVVAAHPPEPIKIISRTEERSPNGEYTLTFKTENGITIVEHGEFQPTDDGKDVVLVKSGSYTYDSPDGTPVDIKYRADKLGYVASGDAIPVAPQA